MQCQLNLGGGWDAVALVPQDLVLCANSARSTSEEGDRTLLCAQAFQVVQVVQVNLGWPDIGAVLGGGGGGTLQ